MDTDFNDIFFEIYEQFRDDIIKEIRKTLKGEFKKFLEQQKLLIRYAEDDEYKDCRISEEIEAEYQESLKKEKNIVLEPKRPPVQFIDIKCVKCGKVEKIVQTYEPKSIDGDTPPKWYCNSCLARRG